MAVSFLNNTCYFRGISFGNQREVLLRHGRCAHFARPAGRRDFALANDATGALAHVHAHAHAHALAPLFL